MVRTRIPPNEDFSFNIVYYRLLSFTVFQFLAAGSIVLQFQLHVSMNSVGCHQDSFSTCVRVCSSGKNVACQRIRQEFKTAFSKATLAPFSKKGSRFQSETVMCACVCVSMYVFVLASLHVFGHVWPIALATLARHRATFDILHRNGIRIFCAT